MSVGGSIADNIFAIINKIDNTVDRQKLLAYANRLEVEVDRLNEIIDELNKVIKTTLNKR